MILISDGRFLLPMKQFDYFITSSDASLYGNAFCIITPFHHVYMILRNIFQKKTIYYYTIKVFCYRPAPRRCTTFIV
jgi:hypothetical protein